MKTFARYWLPALAWMALIWALSTDVGSAEHTSGILLPLLTWLLPGANPSQLGLAHGMIRKLGHVTEYAVLALLWLRALRAERRLALATSAWVALAVAVAWAILDELHQATVGTRTPSAADVVIDAVGATLAIAATLWREGLGRAAAGTPSPGHPRAAVVRPSDEGPACPAVRRRRG